MGATSRRAEQVFERSNKLAKVEREEQKMTATIGRKKQRGSEMTLIEDKWANTMIEWHKTWLIL